MDTLGWCILGFTLLFLGTPLYLYVHRLSAIPSWPTTTALITDAESHRGTPVGSQKYAFTLHYCRAYYAFSINGKSYDGWFALMIEDEGFADTTAAKLRGQEITVRYNLKRPKDSVLVDDNVLGKKVIQKQGVLW